MQNKLVSIILSVYNGEQYLEQCIESVLSQSYESFEFIIVNDGSKDKSLTLIKNMQGKDNRIIIIDKPNSGLTKSLNVGLERSTGEYIARIDADDIWSPSKLEVQVNFMEAHPEILLSGTAINFIDENGDLLDDQNPLDALKDEEIRKIYLFKNPFCHSSVIFRKHIVKQLGPYNSDFKYAQDYEYWSRIMKVGKVEVIPDVLVGRRMTNDMIGIKRNRNQRYFGLRTKLKVFAYSKPSFKGLAHIFKTFGGAVIPSTVAKSLRNIIRN